MKKISILFFLISITTVVRSQSISQTLKALDLPYYKFNEKPAAGQIGMRRNSYDAIPVPLENNNLFAAAYLYYDDLNELSRVSYEMKKNKTKKNGPDIIKLLRENFGTEVKAVVDDHVLSTTYYFVNDNEKATFRFSSGIMGSSLDVTELNNYKLKEVYSESKKTTTISPFNLDDQVVSNNNLSYTIDFSGIIESKSILISIRSHGKELKYMKSIEITLEDGTVTTIDLSAQNEILKSVRVPLIIEVGVANLSETLCKAILESKVVKIKITGEKITGDVILTPSMKKGLELVYHRIYK
ncbi:hypothetical protein [Pedobacter sp. L105]|uniref:hypothetical protein n=1 Tax=Pedobacter sp. L105 TaxID=1641871 RepID=UPI00131ECEEB|nr:hypothetical protein [Pedobacter sp. L105]